MGLGGSLVLPETTHRPTAAFGNWTFLRVVWLGLVVGVFAALLRRVLRRARRSDARHGAAYACLLALAITPFALETAESIPNVRRADYPGPNDGFYDATKHATFALVAAEHQAEVSVMRLELEQSNRVANSPGRGEVKPPSRRAGGASPLSRPVTL